MDSKMLMQQKKKQRSGVTPEDMEMLMPDACCFLATCNFPVQPPSLPFSQPATTNLDGNQSLLLHAAPVLDGYIKRPIRTLRFCALR
jgi:hypothetical protein